MRITKIRAHPTSKKRQPDVAEMDSFRGTNPSLFRSALPETRNVLRETLRYIGRHVSHNFLSISITLDIRKLNY